MMEVPFACGQSFPVSQAHNVGSHLHTDVWAWDFRMPEGIPITAAKDGVVRLARGDSSVGGCDESFAVDANYVVLSHANNYETQYLHLSQVLVKPGDWVKAGQLLGYSGATGWSCGAHLHFKVTQASGPGWNNDSVPAKFIGYGDPQVNAVVKARGCESKPVQVAGKPPSGSVQRASVLVTPAVVQRRTR